jgi:hypothetical protein
MSDPKFEREEPSPTPKTIDDPRLPKPLFAAPSRFARTVEVLAVAVPLVFVLAGIVARFIGR